MLQHACSSSGILAALHSFLSLSMGFFSCLPLLLSSNYGNRFCHLHKLHKIIQHCSLWRTGEITTPKAIYDKTLKSSFIFIQSKHTSSETPEMFTEILHSKNYYLSLRLQQLQSPKKACLTYFPQNCRNWF